MMTEFLKLKNLAFSLILISLFLGGFLGICSLFNKDTHMVAHAQESSAMPMISEAASSCCEIHAPNNNFVKQLGSSIIENKNFGFTTILLASLLLIFLLKFFDQSKKFTASRIYYLRQSIFHFPNYLLLAFARGILNPKIYNQTV